MKAFICLGTHWDREWYEPFQEYRMWLVELMDELIDRMEAGPEYLHFHLDGQTILIEDYLDIRPEKKDRLAALLKAGRISAGPWYLLPDEWLISPESYIRNLQRGHDLCRALDVEAMPYSYTPDQFGHIAALPMIMSGFGITSGLVWRGTQDEHFPNHFIWVAPDGSRMVTHKLTDRYAYASLFLGARREIEKADFSEASFKEHFDPYFENEKARSRHVPLTLLVDGIDHQDPPKTIPRLIGELRTRYPEVTFEWTSLADYAQALAPYADTLPERHGELRQPCNAGSRQHIQYLIVHTLSSRYPIKKRNDECQALMEKWAEPCALFQQMNGGQPIVRYIEKAWEYLLKNHPHDSICGCSIDQVHRDMRYRFDQCELIGDGIVRRALAQLGKPYVDLRHVADATGTTCKDSGDDPFCLAVHNPLPWKRNEVVELAIPFPGGWKHHYVDGLMSGERCNQFVLRNNHGAAIPFQIVRVERDTLNGFLDERGRRCVAQGDTYHVAAELTLPACGATTVLVEPTDGATRNFGSLATGVLSASNGLVDFTLAPGGSGTLSCANSRRSYSGLFLYEDGGDCGDGWTYGNPLNDQRVRSYGTQVTTALDEDGPLRTVFRVERILSLPRALDNATGGRQADRTPLRITDLIYLEKNAPYVRVKTRVENNVRDHRLRVLFPTRIQAEQSFADSPFAVVERDIAIPKETAAWQERVNPEKPFSSFFGIKDEEGGLAVLSPGGLHEYAVTECRDRALALTLFRSTYKTFRTSGEPDGELLQDLDFEYLLFPFTGTFYPVFATATVACRQVGVKHHLVQEMKEDTSMVSLEKENLVVSALKLANNGNGGIIRLWNPSEEAVTNKIHVAVSLESAVYCDLKEDFTAGIAEMGEHTIPVIVPARGLATVRFTWSNSPSE